MESAPASGLLDLSVGVGCGTAGSVYVGRVDEVGLSDEGLRLRLGVLGRAESTLAAMKSRTLAELNRRFSSGDAQRLVRDELQVSGREAKRDVETAARLAELPATSGALESGEIPVGHARLIARASSETPIDESVLVQAANTQPFDEFARTVKRHQQDVADDDGQSLLDRQRKNRKARIFESSDSGMFVLTGEFDQITGARIATALTAKERQLWHREDPKKRATPQQRMADALTELICEPAGDGKSTGTDLLVIADLDVIKQQLDNPRLADGSAIPIVELHRLALEANLLPSIFDTKAQDMWLGRKQRTASEAQRVALIARDQHCIGCGANPLWCRAHHIIWWSKNGPTDVDNLVLVCDDCHHKIHDHGWQVYKHPNTGKYKLKSPNPTNPATAVMPSRRDRATPTEQTGPSRPDRADRTEQTGPSNPRTEQRRSSRPDRATPGPSKNRPTRTEQKQTDPDRADRTEQRRSSRPDRATQIEQTGPSRPDRATQIEQKQTDPDRADRTEQRRSSRPDRATPGPSNPRTEQKQTDPDRATPGPSKNRPTRTEQPPDHYPTDTGDAHLPKTEDPNQPRPTPRRPSHRHRHVLTRWQGTWGRSKFLRRLASAL